MFPRAIDAYRVLPELVWCGFGVLVMLMQPFVRSRHFFTFLALIGTLAGTAASLRGIFRAAAVCHGRHGRAGFGAGTADRVYRARGELDLQLHPGGLPARLTEIL